MGTIIGGNIGTTIGIHSPIPYKAPGRRGGDFGQVATVIINNWREYELRALHGRRQSVVEFSCRCRPSCGHALSSHSLQGYIPKFVSPGH